ncbi:site-specific DNA recombinase [Actinokineospora baliensis]|uniref:recombinase family protein n=1 Tax=Actinokineospora baliensis TaxID=547056 RepID=UPI00195C3F0F|nr:recombinase family protein [Actinokineospora baliensis]MBM7770913.1 site-specific DNA recombinase [Actinokineospora baliensis]
MADAQVKRAVSVVRLSSYTDVTTSPTTQSGNNEAEITRRGMIQVGEAMDLDVSGSKVSPFDRPQLGAWLRNPHLFDALVFRSIDRLCRNLKDFVTLLEWAEENGKQLICLNPDIDFSSMIGKVIAFILAAFAEMEGKAIGDRVRGARTHMRKVARWGAGRVSYGYRTCPHPDGVGYALEPDPETAPIIREAVLRVIAGEPMLSVVRLFNDRCIPTGQEVARNRRAEKANKKRGGKKKSAEELRSDDDRRRAGWAVPALRRILRSESLRNVVHSGEVIERDEDGMPLRYGESIVTDQEFRDLQAAIAKRADPDRAGRPPQAALLGILWCVCGDRMYRTPSKDHVAYRCKAGYEGRGVCPGASVHAAEVEEYVEREFLALTGDLPLLLRTVDPGEDHSGEIVEVEAAIDDLTRDRYEGGLFKGEKGETRYRTMMTNLETRLTSLHAAPRRPAGVKWVSTGVTYRQEWQSTSWTTRRERLRENGVRIEISGKISDGVPMLDRIRFDHRKPAATGSDEPMALEHWA